MELDANDGRIEELIAELEARETALTDLPDEVMRAEMMRYLTDADREALRQTNRALRRTAGARAMHPTWGHVQAQERQYAELCDRAFRDPRTGAPLPIARLLDSVARRLDALAHTILWTPAAQARCRAQRDADMVQYRLYLRTRPAGSPEFSEEEGPSLFHIRRRLGLPRYEGDAAADAAELAAMTAEERATAPYGYAFEVFEEDALLGPTITATQRDDIRFFREHVFWRVAYAQGTLIARLAANQRARYLGQRLGVGCTLEEGPFISYGNDGGFLGLRDRYIPPPTSERFQLQVMHGHSALTEARFVRGLEHALQCDMMATAAMTTRLPATGFPVLSRLRRLPLDDMRRYLVIELAGRAENYGQGGGQLPYRVTHINVFVGGREDTDIVFSGTHEQFQATYTVGDADRRPGAGSRLFMRSNRNEDIEMWLDTHVGTEQYMAIETRVETENADVVEMTVSCHYDPMIPTVDVAHAIRLVRLGWGTPFGFSMPILAPWPEVTADREPIAQVRPLPGTQTTVAGTPLTRKAYLRREYPSLHFRAGDNEIYRDEGLVAQLQAMLQPAFDYDAAAQYFLDTQVPRYAAFKGTRPPTLPPSHLYEGHVTF